VEKAREVQGEAEGRETKGDTGVKGRCEGKTCTHTQTCFGGEEMHEESLNCAVFNGLFNGHNV